MAENAKRTMPLPTPSMSDRDITFPLGGPTVGASINESVPLDSIPEIITPLVQEWFNAGFVWPSRSQTQYIINALDGATVLPKPIKDTPCPWPRQSHMARGARSTSPRIRANNDEVFQQRNQDYQNTLCLPDMTSAVIPDIPIDRTQQSNMWRFLSSAKGETIIGPNNIQFINRKPHWARGPRVVVDGFLLCPTNNITMSEGIPIPNPIL